MTITDICDLPEFLELLSNYEYVVVKFSAEWCAPCKRIHPLYERLSNNEKYTSVCFVHVDVDEARDLCEKYEVSNMPTFILFQNSEETERFPGANEGKLIDMLSKCKSDNL